MTTLPLYGMLRNTPFRRVVTCPNCWHSFPPEDVLWIGVHPNVAAEPQLPSKVAGAERKRFIPERFDPEGRALDSEGAPCTQVACRRCKLSIPRACLELPSIVFSVLGAPGSGKSVFLASMTFSLRQQAASLGFRFQDADLSLNKLLLEDERRMFLDSGSEKFRAIDAAIQKTQEADDARYRTSTIDGHSAKFVPPFTFLLGPGAEHPRGDEYSRLASMLCLYDNAGEHFMPGSDAAGQPMTRHLASSKGLIYTFDPTKDRRVRSKLGESLTSGAGVDRQDSVLLEAANRIREHAGVSPTSRVPQPLVVVLTKFDVWKPLLSKFEDESPLKQYPNSRINALFVDPVQSLSQACRKVLWATCPEIVSAAESVSDDVTYVPVAAVGWNAKVDPLSGLKQFRTADCHPFGVLVPLLLLLNKTSPRLCLSVRRRTR